MEKLTELEARQKRLERGYAHEVTIFKGVMGAQGIDIKEIKIDVRDISQRLESMQDDINNLRADIKQILTLITTGKSEL